ncbi:MAG: metallophosphoesterase [Pseudomonadota bacterium]
MQPDSPGNTQGITLRFIHTSDWHLGMTRHYLKGEAQARFTQDRIDIIGSLATLAVREHASFMVVCGDVFDANEVAPQTVQRAAEKLADFPVPVFILPGNHDPLNAASVYDHRAFVDLPDHIHVLRNNGVISVPGAPGIEIVAAPWHRKQVLSDLVAQMLGPLQPVREGGVRIAVAHGQLDSLSADRHHPATIGIEPVRAALGENKIQYLALGDRHSLTDCDDSGRIWYSGTPVATDFNETSPNQVLLVDASVGIDPRAQVQPVTVGQWQFEQLHDTINNAQDIDRFEKTLSDLRNKERVVARLVLDGALKLEQSARLSTVLDTKRALFASLRIHDPLSNLTVLPDVMDIDSLTLSGYARSAWDDLAGQAVSNAPGSQVATDALELFYRLAHVEKQATGRRH